MAARFALMSTMAVVVISLVVGVLYHAPTGIDGLPDVRGGIKNMVAAAAYSVEANAGPVADDPLMKGILTHFKDMEVRSAAEQRHHFVRDLRQREIEAARLRFPASGMDMPSAMRTPESPSSSP